MDGNDHACPLWQGENEFGAALVPLAGQGYYLFIY